MNEHLDDSILVLLVENDPVDKMAFLRFVEREHLPYRCVTATSVEEARRHLRSRLFDIVLADYSLDDGTALDVLKAVKDTPVVVVTGSGNERVAAAAMKSGASDYVIKDPAGNYLITLPLVVQNAITRKRTERDLRRYREQLEALVEERTAELIAANSQLRSEVAERERAERALKEKVSELEAIYRIGVAISAQLDTQTILQLIVEQCAPLVNAASCSVLLPDPEDGRELVFVAAVDGIVGVRVPPGKGIASRVIGQGVPQIVNDVAADPDYYAAVSAERGVEIKSLLAVPLIVQGNTIGVLEAVNKRTEEFTTRDQDVLLMLAYHAAIALNNARLYEKQQEELARRIQVEERLRAIHQLGIELSLLRDEGHIMARVMDVAVSLFQFDNIGYGLVDEKAGELVYYLTKEGGRIEPLLRLPLGGERGIGVEVVRTGRAIRLADVRESARHVPQPGKEPRGSELCVPMKVRERVIGVLNVESDQAGRFTAADEQILQTLANQAAAAIENARLYREAREQTRLLATINAVGSAITSSLDTDVILRRLLEMTCRAVDAERGSFLWLDEKSGELVFALSMEDEQASLGGQRLPPGQGIAGWVARYGEPVIINDVSQDPRYNGTAEQLTGVSVRSVLCAPLRYRERTLGVVEIVNKRGDDFTEKDMALLKAVSSAAASALENARLYAEQKRLLRKQRQAQARLIQAEKMGALGRLTASITHEINNPLQAVQGCLTLVSEELNSERRDEVMQRYLGIAEGEILRIAEIVRRMRDFYRPAQEEMKPTDIRSVVESVLALSNKQLQHRHVTVHQEWETPLPLVQANPDHLKQVFLNLVLNAMDAMPDGGELFISGDLEQSADARKPYLRLRFRDTGEGIDPKALPRLFEPFFTTKEDGSGLGLYISYGIIQAHQGRITASNAEGGGAVFTILLPTM